jgi:pimeloyl-ACP methyl ester carboxylesterase
VRLHADDGGTGGLPVVFLHSAAGNTTQWSHQLEHLRPERRAIALDWRGHGKSGFPDDGDFSIPALAEDVEGTLNEIGVRECVLVGHSAGGLVALEFAARDPERVLGLMLADPAGDFTRVPREMMEPLLAGLDSDAYRETIGDYWNSNLSGSGPEVRERVLADLEATPQQTIVGLFRAQMNYDPVSALRRYPGPKFSLVTPDNDSPYSLHNLGEDLPHEFFPGTGHWLHMDRPEDFDPRMDDFLAEAGNET